jgi:hypothetical protein
VEQLDEEAEQPAVLAPDQGGNQRSSEAIRGHQRPSDVISEVISEVIQRSFRGHHLRERCLQLALQRIDLRAQIRLPQRVLGLQALLLDEVLLLCEPRRRRRRLGRLLRLPSTVRGRLGLGGASGLYGELGLRLTRRLERGE